MRYWAGVGKYQALYERLYRQLVPAEGYAGSRAGELLRAISALYLEQLERDEKPLHDYDQNYFRYLILSHFTISSRWKIRTVLFHKKVDDDDWDWLLETVILEVAKLQHINAEAALEPDYST